MTTGADELETLADAIEHNPALLPVLFAEVRAVRRVGRLTGPEAAVRLLRARAEELRGRSHTGVGRRSG